MARKRVDDYLNANPDSNNLGPLDLEPCDAFLRKCLFEEVRQRFELICNPLVEVTVLKN